MKNIKLIIFDLDGTFYDIKDVIEGVYDCQLDFLCQQRKISRDEAKEIFTRNSIFPYASADSKSCTEYFESIGINKAEWASFRESNFDVMRIDPVKAVDPVIINKFASQYKIYLLSSNTYGTIQRILNRLKIDADLFARIISSDRFVSSNRFNKREAMSAIIQSCALNPKECLSIGDRYNTDILPMLELGGRGALVKTPRAIGVLFERLCSNDVRTCEEFVCYEPMR